MEKISFNFEFDMLSELIKMKNGINGQIKHELMSWLRLIEFYRQENALLKYRLSELVDNNDENNFLQVAEHFQNEFLLKDEALKRLIKSLQEYSDMVENAEAISARLLSSHNLLRKEIRQFEKKYSGLSTDFNQKMLQNI